MLMLNAYRNVAAGDKHLLTIQSTKYFPLLKASLKNEKFQIIIIVRTVSPS